MTTSTGPERALGAGAGALAAVAAFLPWATVATIFGSFSVNGFADGEGDGMFTTALGVLGALMMFVAGGAVWPRVIAGLAGAAIAAIGFYDLSNVRSMIAEVDNDTDGFARASTGFGLYLTIAAGIALAVCAVVATRNRHPQLRAGAPLPPPAYRVAPADPEVTP